MYSTDLSDARWKYIKKTLQYGNRKRKHSLRHIWNAILYLVKTGCHRVAGAMANAAAKFSKVAAGLLLL